MQGTRSSLVIKIPDNELLKAHIGIVVDQTAASREREGMKKFADLTHGTGNLAPVRIAVMSKLSPMTRTTSDLTTKRSAGWKSIEDAFTSIEDAKNKLTACVSPPDTGKTTVLADITIGAVICGHTTLVCAVSNNALRAVYNA